MTNAPVSTEPTTLLLSATTNTTPVWNEFHSKWCRDLAWVMLSPGLISGSLSGYPHAHERLWGLPANKPALVHWLHQQDTKLLQTPPSQPSHARLGHYCEALLAFALADPFIQAISGLELVQRNIQIRRGKQTLGELDFLLRAPNNCGLHVEVAVKFYLLKRHTANPLAWHHWIGPNATDRLDIKLNRLTRHQLALLHNNPAIRTEIAEIDNTRPLAQLSSAYYLKGMFFIHWLDNSQQPMCANEQCLMGHWLTRSEFESLKEAETLHFTQLGKQQWLTGMLPGESPCPSQLPEPPFMVIWYKDSADEPQSRLMIVPDHWPETNSPSRII